MNPQDFKYDNNYDIRTNYTRVKYGANRGLLETELNEMQKIQEETRASLIRKIIPSGFVELKRADIIGDSIMSFPNNAVDAIAIAPCKVFVNGYEVAIEGKEVIDGAVGWLKINTPAAPATSTRMDFAFLEFWFEELDENAIITKYGYESGDIMENKLVDPRVNEETSHRVSLKWRYRVEQSLDFTKWPSGFGYKTDGDFSPIYAYGHKGQKVNNVDYTFRSATDDIFKDCSFYMDNGLWVAGRPTSTTANSDLQIVDNYVYAIPLVKIKRRNSQPYSIDNPYGASQWVDINSVSTHPDELFYNKIELVDMNDMRRSISFSGWNYNTMLERTLKDLVSGNMEIKANEHAHRIQFGAPSLSMASNPNIIFISKFADNTTTETGATPSIVLGNQSLKYGFGTVGDGLVLNGSSAVEYSLATLDKLKGTVDFFFNPFWSSSDTNITQTLFSFIEPSSNTKVFEFKKTSSQLVLTVRLDSTGRVGSSYDLPIDLSTNIIQARKIYHIRVSWDYAGRSIQLYLNGRQIAANTYTGTSLNPSVLRIGEVEAIDPTLFFTNTIIDEVSVYNQAITDFAQLRNDFIQDNLASIYPSFNGYLSGFFDNAYEQKDYVKEVVTVNAATSVILMAPYGILISSTVPKVFDSNGVLFAGTWSGLGTSQSTFTLTSGTFNGSNVYIQHNLLVAAGNGPIDLPTAVIKGDLNGKEASFSRFGTGPRAVNLINPRITVGQMDEAYDYCSSTRTNDQCFARLLTYYIEGNGQNKYYLPNTLYGYDVIGIMAVSKKYDNIVKIYDDATKSFEIDLNQALIKGQYVQIQVLLGGLSFDYQIHNKALISNTTRTTSIILNAPGNTDTFTVRLDVNSGYNIAIASTVNFKNQFDSNGNLTGVSKKYVAYVDGIETELLSISGYGTPFLTFKFNSTPLIGQKIELPVLAAYNPTKNDIVSVWLKHVPYQGIMNSSPQKLRRISNWLQFITTLSSGNIIPTGPIPIRSINNAFNRLPGGAAYTHILTAEPIIVESDNPITLYSGLKPNNYFITFRETRNILFSDDLDSYFVELDDEFVIKKGQSNFQDGKLEAPYSLYGFYLPDTITPINKYAGAACLVVNESGELLLFLFGHAHDFKSTTNTIAKPVYGDLFYIKGKPTVLSKK